MKVAAGPRGSGQPARAEAGRPRKAGREAGKGVCVPRPHLSRGEGKGCRIRTRDLNPSQGARLARADFRVSVAAQSEEFLCFNPRPPPRPISRLEAVGKGDCEAAALLMALGPLVPIFPVPKVEMRSRRLAIVAD